MRIVFCLFLFLVLGCSYTFVDLTPDSEDLDGGDGGDASDSPYIPVEDITVDPTTMTLRIRETAAVAATVYPENASFPEVTWESEDPAVATVDAEGVVTAVFPGYALIRATAEVHYSARTEICVPDESPDAVTGGVLASREIERLLHDRRLEEDCAKLISCSVFPDSEYGMSQCREFWETAWRASVSTGYMWDSYCPAETYPDRIVTVLEYHACVAALTAPEACWCLVPADCFEDMAVPADCTAASLCDARDVCD